MFEFMTFVPFNKSANVFKSMLSLCHYGMFGVNLWQLHNNTSILVL